MKTKFVALALLCLLIGLPVFGQTFGEITGEVRDTSGASVPGVAVTIINAATNANRSTVSNDAGITASPLCPRVSITCARKSRDSKPTPLNRWKSRSNRPSGSIST